KIGRAVNTTGAYVDRLVLNLYTGPGAVDVWIDDLDIGPVKPPAEPKTGAPGVPVKRPGVPEGAPRGRIAEQRGGQLFVAGKACSFRAVGHTGAPLHVLRQAGFDALWVPADASPEVLEEANREGWLLVPAAPLASASVNAGLGAALERDADALAHYLRKF